MAGSISRSDEFFYHCGHAIGFGDLKENFVGRKPFFKYSLANYLNVFTTPFFVTETNCAVF